LTGNKSLQRSAMAIAALAIVFCVTCPGFIHGARAAQSSSGGGVAEIPYSIDYDGWFTVKATVNGEGPYDFIVDTGATLSLVFQKLLDRQQFPAVDQPPRRVLGLSSVGTLPVYRIGDIDLGGVGLRDHHGVVLADWSPPRRTPDGVIGLDFLTQYFVVFDRPTKTLRLYPRGMRPEIVRGWTSTRLRAEDFDLASGDLFTLTGRIRQRPIRFILDLGASGTLINSAAFSSLLSGVSITRWSDHRGKFSTRISGAFDEEGRAVVLSVRRFSIGNARWKKRRFSIYNPLIFEELGVTNKAFGLLGADLFLDRSFAIDFQGGRFFIGPEVKNAPRRRTELAPVKGPGQ